MRGNEKFIRRQKEIARQKAQEEKRQKRVQREGVPKAAAGDDEVAAIQAAIDAGIDPRTLQAQATGMELPADGKADGEAAPRRANPLAFQIFDDKALPASAEAGLGPLVEVCRFYVPAE